MSFRAVLTGVLVAASVPVAVFAEFTTPSLDQWGDSVKRVGPREYKTAAGRHPNATWVAPYSVALVSGAPVAIDLLPASTTTNLPAGEELALVAGHPPATRYHVYYPATPSYPAATVYVPDTGYYASPRTGGSPPVVTASGVVVAPSAAATTRVVVEPPSVAESGPPPAPPVITGSGVAVTPPAVSGPSVAVAPPAVSTPGTAATAPGVAVTTPAAAVVAPGVVVAEPGVTFTAPGAVAYPVGTYTRSIDMPGYRSALVDEGLVEPIPGTVTVTPRGTSYALPPAR